MGPLSNYQVKEIQLSTPGVRQHSLACTSEVVATPSSDNDCGNDDDDSGPGNDDDDTGGSGDGEDIANGVPCDQNGCANCLDCIDNDGDGLFDCDDTDCALTDNCKHFPHTCP